MSSPRIMNNNIEIIPDKCIIKHPLVKDLLNKRVLEINLRQERVIIHYCISILLLFRTERSVTGEPDTKQFENKSYRFSAYRSMFFWLDKRKGSKKYRRALPACLGKTVHLILFVSQYIFLSHPCEETVSKSQKRGLCGP